MTAAGRPQTRAPSRRPDFNARGGKGHPCGLPPDCCPRPARPGPALTCGVDGGGARGRRGAQPQPEMQRGPEHARAQQHQPVSHWPPPPAPPRAPGARRALPRPGGGQGTCERGGRRPRDRSERTRRRPGSSRFPAPPRTPQSAAATAGRPESRPLRRPPRPALPSLARHAPSLASAPASAPAPASPPGAEVRLRAPAGGAPVTRRLRNYISQNATHWLASLGGHGGEERGPTLSMRIPFHAFSFAHPSPDGGGVSGSPAPRLSLRGQVSTAQPKASGAVSASGFSHAERGLPSEVGSCWGSCWRVLGPGAAARRRVSAVIHLVLVPVQRTPALTGPGPRCAPGAPEE